MSCDICSHCSLAPLCWFGLEFRVRVGIGFGLGLGLWFPIPNQVALEGRIVLRQPHVAHELRAVGA